VKKFLLFSITLSLILTGIPNTHGVWRGTLDVQNKRAVPILYGAIGSCASSAFLYSPRIVFTAAHVLYEGDDRKIKPTKVRSMVWVGKPGEAITNFSTRVASEKIFTPANFEARDLWNGGSTITRKNDFAVIVLSEPLPVDDKRVELLTPEIHQKYIENREKISLTGYGYQTINDHRKCNENRLPSSFTSTIISKVYRAGNQGWTTSLNTQVEGNQPNMCDGDSGSGYVKITESGYLYLGPSGAGSYGNHNCEDYPPALGGTTINGADPVYLFLDLIAQAEKYLADSQAAAALKAKQEAEAKAAAELKAKQVAEEKAAAELKAKQEADAIAAAELKAKEEADVKAAAQQKAKQEAAAKAAATKRTTITCVKGKLIKKVSAVKPKCPAGYKKK
jgi:hypothetical protein